MCPNFHVAVFGKIDAKMLRWIMMGVGPIFLFVPLIQNH